MSTWVFAGAYAVNTMIVYYAFGKINSAELLHPKMALFFKSEEGAILNPENGVILNQKMAPF